MSQRSALRAEDVPTSPPHPSAHPGHVVEGLRASSVIATAPQKRWRSKPSCSATRRSGTRGVLRERGQVYLHNEIETILNVETRLTALPEARSVSAERSPERELELVILWRAALNLPHDHSRPARRPAPIPSSIAPRAGAVASAATWPPHHQAMPIC